MQHRVALLLIVAITLARSLFACAPAPHAGEQIDVVEESAVIVWDPATKTQHFIRRATFRGNARDFGFLVPTPTEPTLAAVDDGIFDTLQAKIEPPTIERTRREIRWTLLGTFRLALRHRRPLLCAIRGSLITYFSTLHHNALNTSGNVACVWPRC